LLAGKEHAEFVFNLGAEGFAQFFLGTPGDEEVEVWRCLVGMADEFRLADASTTCHDCELRVVSRESANLAQNTRLLLSSVEFHSLFSKTGTAVTGTLVPVRKKLYQNPSADATG
jgi:hypothetical protein